MGVNIGTRTAQKMYVGEKEVLRVYNGANLVFPDKLKEGEDYEVFDWLRNAKTNAYIRTNQGYDGLSDITLTMERYRKTSEADYNFGCSKLDIRSDIVAPYRLYVNGQADSYCIWSFQTIGSFILTYHNGTWSNLFLKTMERRNVYKKLNAFQNPISLFRLGVNSTTSQCSIGKFDINNVRFRPCKLLHDISPNHDSLGKTRGSNECGMIELNSGIFYGNAATTGTFTVYNDPVYITGCKIQIPNRYSVNPATLIVTGRANVSKLTSTAKDYGIAKISKDYVLMGHYIIGEGVATYAVDSSTWGQGYADIKFTYDLGYAAYLTINGKALTPAENPPFGQIESAMLDLTDGVLEISKVYQKVYDTATTTSEHNYTAIKKDGRFALQDDFDGQIYYQE